jgi:isopenicillin N synthase-like dioxygenase
MERYRDEIRTLSARVHRLFALDLGLKRDFFDPFFSNPMATLRLLHYPSVPRIEQKEPGAGAHTDYGNITLLAQDSVGGLEVRWRDGRWISAPPISNTFICNIGDCLMRWSNDTYVSNPHRVVSPVERERYSIAYFSDPDPEADIRCLPGCSSATNPPHYAPISAADYLRQRFEATYAYRRAGAGA